MNYEEILKELILQDERIVILTCENRIAIRSLPDKLKDRYIDIGIAEQSLVGIASGLALQGRIPIVHALSPFLTMRSFEFIRTNIGLQNLPVKLVGSISGFQSEGNGPTHQAIEDIALMRLIPNMNIFAPADNDDLNKCIKNIILSNKPFYIRYINTDPIIEHTSIVEIGKGEKFGGGDILIITYGLLFTEAYKTALLLISKGYSVELINLRFLKPIDEELIVNSIKKSRIVVTIEDHFSTGGLYSIICEIAIKNNLQINPLSINLNEKWFKPSYLNTILDYEGFSAEKIFKKIINKLGNNNGK